MPDLAKATLIAGAITLAFAMLLSLVMGAFMLSIAIFGKIGPLIAILAAVFVFLWFCAMLDLRDQKRRTLSQGGKK